MKEEKKKHYYYQMRKVKEMGLGSRGEMQKNQPLKEKREKDLFVGSEAMQFVPGDEGGWGRVQQLRCTLQEHPIFGSRFRM